MLKSVDEIQVGKVYLYVGVGRFKSNVISHYLVVSKNEGTTDSFVLYCVYDEIKDANRQSDVDSFDVWAMGRFFNYQFSDICSGWAHSDMVK